MTQKEIESILGWSIRHGKGFYYNGKQYTGIAFHEDCISIYTSNINSITYINYEDIEKIENIKIKDGKDGLRKAIFTK